MILKNIPTVFVIFGATGDLMYKKITPALFNLFQKEKLPKMLRIIGVARRPLTDDDFKQHIIHILRERLNIKRNSKELQAFLKHFSYHSGRFEDKNTYRSLSKLVGRIDDEWKVCANKLFYLAVPPEFYENMFNHLDSSGLTEPCSPEEGWTRVLLEKPFGKNAHDAKRVDLLLAKYFKEEQIYRIDHYLAKEMLQNILSFRFANNLFEQSWNNKFIEKVEIRALEKIGVEKRGLFYDGLGALVDFGQNHLLQMVALVAMDHPVNLEYKAVRKKRTEILKTLKIPSQDEIKENTFRAQHIGYNKIKGVRQNSDTETYFKVRLYLETPRWKGVPFYIESGKSLKDQIKQIAVTFKHITPCICPLGNHYKNTVTFSIEPQESIRISFLTKKPGIEKKIEVDLRKFNFIYRKKSGNRVQYVEEYEKLLLDCVNGNQLLFLSTEEVKSMWNYIQPIVDAWHQNKVPLHKYKKDTNNITKEATLLSALKEKQVGIIGLGKMGLNLGLQLIEKGWSVTGYNRTPKVTKDAQRLGLKGAFSIQDFVSLLNRPRLILLMVKPGKAVDEIIFGKKGLINYVQKGDIIIDAGNSFYKDSVSRYKKLKKKGIGFVDVGLSGGPSGARNGASLMVGGDKKHYQYLQPLFNDIATAGGLDYFGEPGSGHFVKMVHNGIEYGMLQAIAEGFNILKKAEYKLDLNKVAQVYSNGTVIESKLIEWLKEGLKIYGTNANDITGKVIRGGTGDWTVNEAKELGVKARVIEESVKFRKQSEKNPSYTGKIVNIIRNMFGGHSIKKD